MANVMNVKDIDRNFFWELVDDGFAKYKDTDVVQIYLSMICNKLEKDTGIYFKNDSHWAIISDRLGIRIESKDIKDYDSLLALIEQKLGGSNTSARADAQLLNDMSGIIDYAPYYENDKGQWKCYDRYGQDEVFEIWYYGLYGKYHDDLAFSHELGKKYLEEVDWRSPKVYQGTIDELDGMNVAFYKNGNIKIKSKMSQLFWDNINHLYDVADPKGYNHRNR